MKCIKKSLGTFAPKYPLDNFCVPKQTLFIDIETTGLHANSSTLYLIGCVYYDTSQVKSEWHTIQWFATNYEDEKEILKAFADFSKNYRYLIHFNGNQFDIPYLTKKFEQHHIRFDFSSFDGIDLYRRIAPYKSFLKLPDCKQKTIEDYLGNSREDIYSGGELIEIYHEYVLTQDAQKEHFLLLHNEEDIKGMLDITAILAIPDLFHNPVKVTKVQANYYNDVNQKRCAEIIMNLRFIAPLPAAISYSTNGCYFSGNGTEGKLKVPLFEEEMKYFYSNYKDYYYLPKEDIAIHKSVASYVDKEFREPAHASNCYTRKISAYLPQWDVEFTPFFKKDYQSKELFFELTDEMKTQREEFNRYALHVLQMLGTSR